MGVFQASIMKTLQSLRDMIKSVKKPTSEAGVISASDPKPGPNQLPYLRNHSDESMETKFVGPPLPPQFVQRFESEILSDPNLD